MLQVSRLFFFLFFCVSLVWGQQNQGVFKHHTIKDGLSQTTVYAICQDSLGYMWFGTLDGLNKYDGYRYKVYRYNHKDSNSISDNITSVLFADNNMDIWIGTFSKGLSKYNYEKDNFENYIYSQACTNCPNSNTIRTINQDAEGYLWIGSNNGLNRYDKIKKQFENYNHLLPESKQHAAVIYSIVFDKNQTMWLGTNKGLMKLNKITNKFEIISVNANAQVANVKGLVFDKQDQLWMATSKGIWALNSLTYESINFVDKIANNVYLKNVYTNCVFLDSEDNLWFGTDEKGAIQYIPYKNQWMVYQHEPYNPKSIGNKRIWGVFEDRNKKLWFGTDIAGADSYNPHEVFFDHYFKHPLQANNLNDNNIWAFCDDDEGNVYIGTDAGGLNIYNAQNNTFAYLRAGTGSKAIASDYVRCLLHDDAGNIWIGTNKGLNVLTKGGNIKHYKYIKNNPNSLSCDKPRIIYQDSKKNIWIGSEIGLSRYNPVKDNFDKFFIHKQDTQVVNNNRIWALAESSDGHLWVGTCGEGLYKLNLITFKFEDYYYSLNSDNSCLNEIVRCIYEDKNQNVWLATSYGLARINPKTKDVKCYYEDNGLPNNLVYGILPDNSGNLWLSTNYGISKFNTTSEQFKNYTVIDGLQNNEFNQGAYYKGKSGKMYFGGINGFNAFYPEKIETQIAYPKVVITDFKIFNKSVVIGESKVLSKHISLTDATQISYKENVISIEFSALNFSNPEHNYYYYKLEGFDKDWVYAGNSNSVTYTNLDPKKYTFKVKCSNNNLVWGDNYTALQIIITPPFYKTYWFLLIIVLLIVLAIVFYIRIRLYLLKKRNKILTRLVEIRTIEISEQSDKIFEQKEEISAQKDKIEEQLNKLKNAYSELEKLSFVASKTDNAVIICSSNGKIEWTNQAFKKFYNDYILDLDKYVGKSIKELYQSSEIEKLIERCIANGETVSFSTTLSARNKDTKYIQTTLTYVYNENLDYSNIIAVASDYTQIKQTLDELNFTREAAAADRTKMDFLANMSHEIRTPLNAILGFADLLKEEVKNTKSKEYLSIISNNAYSLLKLITDILEIAKTDITKTSFALSPVNISEMIGEIIGIYQIELLRKQVNVDIEKSVDFPEWSAFDNSRLRQILLNVLGNAIKFTDKGKILVKLSVIAVNKEFGSVDMLLEIIDSGVGINAEMKSKIFGLFQQAETGISRKYEGVGIGLSVTKKLIDVLGGHIHIESEINKGTTVTLIFKNVGIIENFKNDMGTGEMLHDTKHEIESKNQFYKLLSMDISDVLINFNRNSQGALLQHIDDKIIDELMYIRKSAKINQIKSFASKIIDNPIFDDIQILKQLSEQLQREAESFNVKNIHLILDKINEIIIFIKTIQ